MSHLLVQGDARRLPLADGSVHCVVTSPPYWGLRDYSCDGQLGLESTPDAFVAAMVAVFREVKRVLRDDGTLWLNIGDSYFNDARGGLRPSAGLGVDGRYDGVACVSAPGLKPKDLVGIPWRVALALQADGWWLRSEIIWAKPNPMPESVTDRPTKAHEQVFLLAKSERYFFDRESVRETAANPGANSERKTAGTIEQAIDPIRFRTRPAGRNCGSPPARNLRTVWSIPTEAYPGAHFATYPRKLVEPCIKAGTSGRGVCPECGAPWERVVERGGYNGQRADISVYTGQAYDRPQSAPRGPKRNFGEPTSTTLGWRPTCPHDAEPIPATVLDPFAGSGTTLVVANALGRRAIGCDLSAEYLGLARRRITRPHAAVPRPTRPDGDDLPLFAGAAS